MFIRNKNNSFKGYVGVNLGIVVLICNPVNCMLKNMLQGKTKLKDYVT